ncbi:MAG: hypothetical protein NZM31_09885 [Gemmatales bacterium]|nr:hypothetical protein [Gemmatales bacterium]MDW8387304.1 hypothetical protein [Gemmatales bacterium]
MKKSFVGLALLLAVLIGANGCGGTSAPAAGLVKPVEQVGEEQPVEVGDTTTASESAGSFGFASDGVGKLLAERLTPPRHDPPPPVPFRSSPESRPLISLDQAPDLSLPWPQVSLTPRLLPSESVRKDATRPVLDLPPMSSDLHRLPLPTTIWFPVTVKAYAPSPDPLALSPSSPAALERADVTDDPTSDLTRAVHFGLAEPLRRQAAPPADIGIPDPFELRRQSRPLPVLDETTVPTTNTDRPKVTLP